MGKRSIVNKILVKEVKINANITNGVQKIAGPILNGLFKRPIFVYASSFGQASAVQFLSILNVVYSLKKLKLWSKKADLTQA